MFINVYCCKGGHLVKKVSFRFLKDGLAAELLREMCKGV